MGEVVVHDIPKFECHAALLLFKIIMTKQAEFSWPWMGYNR